MGKMNPELVESNLLEKSRKKFGDWRRRRKGRSRIPERLWESAVEAARAVGVNQASRALGLEYYALKKRLEAESNGSVLKPAAGFVEMDISGELPLLTEWTVEMEDGKGSRLRIAARSSTGPDISGLCRAFLGEEK